MLHHKKKGNETLKNQTHNQTKESKKKGYTVNKFELISYWMEQKQNK